MFWNKNMCISKYVDERNNPPKICVYKSINKHVDPIVDENMNNG